MRKTVTRHRKNTSKHILQRNNSNKSSHFQRHAYDETDLLFAVDCWRAFPDQEFQLDLKEFDPRNK